MSTNTEANESNEHEGRKSQSLLNRIRKTSGQFGLFVVLLTYTGIGAVIFKNLEGPPDLDRRMTLRNQLLEGRSNFTQAVVESSLNGNEFNYTLNRALSTYEKILEQVSVEGMSLIDPQIESKWDYIRSFFFASTVITTIGYGNLVPRTQSGRVFCMVFALIGIPLTLMVLSNVGKLLASVLSSLYKRCRRLESGVESLSSSSTKPHGKFITAVLVVGGLAIYISLGGLLFTSLEKWSFFDAFYFCFITMTTIGFGDIVPLETRYALLCTVYFMVGLALCSMAIELVQSQYADSFKKMHHLSAHLHELSGPLTESLKRCGDNLDASVLHELREFKKALSNHHQIRVQHPVKDT